MKTLTNLQKMTVFAILLITAFFGSALQPKNAAAQSIGYGQSTLTFGLPVSGWEHSNGNVWGSVALTCANVRCAGSCRDTAAGPVCKRKRKPAPAPTLTCANVLCQSGNRCVESASGPVCQIVDPGPPPPVSCSTVLCAPGKQCVNTSTGPQCVRQAKPERTCEHVSCRRGTQCVMKGKRTRCERVHPRPSPTCANVRCARGTQCVMRGHRPRCVAKPVVNPTPRPTACRKIYHPVCAVPQTFNCVTTPCIPPRKTFGNACSAHAAGYTVVAQGRCH